ncbi:hypothetical protein [Flavobacterium sp.]|uniref:hypothetical protein n=1 Tax=Flavobacterium sp. TaxID=239 RepID=UPI0031D6441F
MSNPIVIINPANKKNIDILNKNQTDFEIGFVFKSIRIKTELTKERSTKNKLRNNVIVPPYVYIKVPLKFSG